VLLRSRLAILLLGNTTVVLGMWQAQMDVETQAFSMARIYDFGLSDEGGDYDFATPEEMSIQ
jgi:hypothetical protein